MKQNGNITTFEQHLEQQYGKPGTLERDAYQAEFETFKMGVLLHQARLDQGLTQEQLAKKCGTTKSYISRIENNVKEVRISTLQRIVERGFGGKLEVKIVL